MVNNHETFGLLVMGIKNTNKIPNKDEGSNTRAMESGSLQLRDPITIPRLQPQASNTIDIPMSNSFLSLENPLFEEEFDVVPANGGASDIILPPVASPLSRGQSDSPQAISNV